MGQQYSIDAKRQKEIEDAIASVKRASADNGFDFYKFHKGSRVMMYQPEKYLNGKALLRLFGGIDIDKWTWRNKPTFEQPIDGKTKPWSIFGICGEGGYKYELFRSTKDGNMGEVAFHNSADANNEGIGGHILFKDVDFEFSYYPGISVGSYITLYMVGEAPFYTAEYQKKTGSEHPIMHLVVHLTCKEKNFWKNQHFVFSDLWTAKRPETDDNMFITLGDDSWAAAVIVNESRKNSAVSLSLRGGVGQLADFVRSTDEALDKYSVYHTLDEAISKNIKNGTSIKLSDQIVYGHYPGFMEIKGKAISIQLQTVVMKPDTGKQSFVAFALRGYIKLIDNSASGKQKALAHGKKVAVNTFFLRNSPGKIGGVHVRRIDESFKDKERYDLAEEGMKNVLSRVPENEKTGLMMENQPRWLSLIFEDLELVNRQGNQTRLTGIRKDGQLGLLLFGSGMIEGQAVTVLTLKINFRQGINRNKDRLIDFILGKNEENPKKRQEPQITAHFHDFFNMKDYYSKLL